MLFNFLIDAFSALQRNLPLLLVLLKEPVLCCFAGRLGEDLIENHLDALNQELVDRMQRGGEAFVSNAVIRGRYVLRACIVNFHTGTVDVEAVPEIAVRLGRTLDSRLRPQTLRG